MPRRRPTCWTRDFNVPAAQPRLGHRHHLRVDRRRLVVPGRGASTCSRAGWSAGRWRAHRHASWCCAALDDGRAATLPEPACCTTRTAAASTPATTTSGRWRDHGIAVQHEPQGQLLGQRRGRELLRTLKKELVYRTRPGTTRSEAARGASSSTSRSSTTGGGATRPWAGLPRAHEALYASRLLRQRKKTVHRIGAGSGRRCGGNRVVGSSATTPMPEGRGARCHWAASRKPRQEASKQARRQDNEEGRRARAKEVRRLQRPPSDREAC